MPNLTVQSPLMVPVVWQGQEYYSSQFFHQQYLMNSPYGAKYQHHKHFLRVLRYMPLYTNYVTLGHIVELTWDRIKAEADQFLVQWQPLFQATGYQPLTLIDMTGQTEFAHHLDDEASKQIAHAANTGLVNQVGRKTGSLLPMERATRVLEAGLQAAKLLGTPLHIAQQEVIKMVESDSGVNLRPLLLAAPAQQNINPDEEMYEPKYLAEALGMKSGVEVNRALEHIGWQVHKIGGGWEPTPAGQPYSSRHAFVAQHSTHSGYNWKWQREAVRNAFLQHGILSA